MNDQKKIEPVSFVLYPVQMNHILVQLLMVLKADLEGRLLAPF